MLQESDRMDSFPRRGTHLKLHTEENFQLEGQASEFDRCLCSFEHDEDKFEEVLGCLVEFSYFRDTKLELLQAFQKSEERLQCLHQLTRDCPIKARAIASLSARERNFYHGLADILCARQELSPNRFDHEVLSITRSFLEEAYPIVRTLINEAQQEHRNKEAIVLRDLLAKMECANLDE